MPLKTLKLMLVIGAVCLPTVAAAQMPIPDDTVIFLQRGNCEMGCPIYRVFIFANGDVIWQGRGAVARRGLVLTRIEGSQIRALIQEFESVDYFQLQNIYGFHGSGCQSSMPDRPMVITTLSKGGICKTISHHDGCVGEVSEKLTALENSIDKAAGTARWITGKPSSRKH